ncbi:response regulator transcription factor [Elusimicrobiota bacterium]
MTNNILIIDDDVDMINAIVPRLKAKGFSVSVIDDSALAVQAGKNKRPGLILIGLNLSGADVLEIIRNLRRTDSLATIPIVALAARDALVSWAQVIQSGATTVLPKQEDVGELMASIISYTPSTMANARASAKKILIVEDDDDTRLGLSLRLKGWGYDVLSEASFTYGATSALDETPDLIILDLGLPDGDGFLLMERLKNHPALGSVPVVILTARDPETYRERSLMAGAAAFFQKPADNDKFLAAIRSALGEQGA